MWVCVCWFETGLIHLVDLRSHANWTHSNGKCCSANAIDCVHVIAVYYIIYIRLSYLQTIKVKISPYDIDNQLVTHLLLCGTWFGEKSFHCWPGLNALWQAQRAGQLAAATATVYEYQIARDAADAVVARSVDALRCLAGSWQPATDNTQLEWE